MLQSVSCTILDEVTENISVVDAQIIDELPNSFPAKRIFKRLLG